MKARCSNPKHKSFARYGGRGITFDPRWSEFAAFLEDMGERPEGTTLERRDNAGPYNKENCIWATPTAQARNKRNNRPMTLGDRTQTLAAWADELDIVPSTLSYRVQSGWSDEAALTTPVEERLRYRRNR